jgi:hypothetical protein
MRRAPDHLESSFQTNYRGEYTMSTLFSFGRGSIGVAISDTRLYATIPEQNGRTVTREWELEPLVRTAQEWPSLATALSELRSAVPQSFKKIAIAVLPPLVQVRRVELPKLSGAPLRQLLSRNAVRYFPNVREPQIVGATMIKQTTPATYVAAAAPSRVVDVVVRTARELSWDVATVIPAHAAWTAAARRRWPAMRKTVNDIAVPVFTHFEVLQIEAGELISTRRFLPEDLSAEMRVHTINQPEQTAAAAAPETDGPEILPEVEYVRRAMARRKLLTRSSIGVAAALVLIAAGVLLHARRQLNAVMEERATLRASVAQVMSVQNDIAALTGPISALQRIETNAPIWSEVFVDVSRNLPDDAYILNFRARNDSLSAEGLAARGAAVFEGMSGAVLIDSVRSAGPIRRQVRPGTKAMDQFTLAARVPNAAPLYASQRRTQP